MYAVLGQLSEETFKQNIQEQKQINRGRQNAEIEGYNTNSIGMNTRLLSTNPTEAFNSLPPGTCCAAHLLYKDRSGGHSVVFTKDTTGQTSILDPSSGQGYSQESQNAFLNPFFITESHASITAPAASIAAFQVSSDAAVSSPSKCKTILFFVPSRFPIFSIAFWI